MFPERTTHFDLAAMETKTKSLRILAYIPSVLLPCPGQTGGREGVPSVEPRKGICVCNKTTYISLFLAAAILFLVENHFSIIPYRTRHISSFNYQTYSRPTYSVLIMASTNKRCWCPWICKEGQILLCFHHETKMVSSNKSDRFGAPVLYLHSAVAV